MRKKNSLRYITRIHDERNHTFCYWVRIGYEIDEKVYKTFPYKRHGGATKALMAAKNWRDKQLKTMIPIMDKAYNRDVNGQRHFGKGVTETWATKGDWEYLSITATYWDGKKGKQLHKQFSVNKWGYDKAVEMATEWRNFKLTGEL